MIDIILNENDLQFENGDLKIADSEQQNIEIIMTAQKGQIYQYPLLGVGIKSKFKGNINKNELRQEIKLELESDNYRVNTIDITGDVDDLNITINAIRKR